MLDVDMFITVSFAVFQSVNCATSLVAEDSAACSSLFTTFLDKSDIMLCSQPVCLLTDCVFSCLCLILCIIMMMMNCFLCDYYM